MSVSVQTSEMRWAAGASYTGLPFLCSHSESSGLRVSALSLRSLLRNVPRGLTQGLVSAPRGQQDSILVPPAASPKGSQVGLPPMPRTLSSAIPQFQVSSQSPPSWTPPTQRTAGPMSSSQQLEPCSECAAALSCPLLMGQAAVLCLAGPDPANRLPTRTSQAGRTAPGQACVPSAAPPPSQLAHLI